MATPQNLALPPQYAALMERVVVAGDLARLAPGERLTYYRAICESLGLNPLTEPFAYITLNGKLKLYALKNCTDQLRASRGISIAITARERQDDLYVVTAQARMGDRQDESIGAVSIKGLMGENLANALMKSETKAKRRVTLSICSLGMLDESEVETIPGATKVDRAKVEPPALPVAGAAGPSPALSPEPVLDLGNAPEAPEGDGFDTYMERPEPALEDDPQALADAYGERLHACQSMDDLRTLWDTIKAQRNRFTAAQHQDLVLRKDLAKSRLGVEMPSAWVRPQAQHPKWRRRR